MVSHIGESLDSLHDYNAASQGEVASDEVLRVHGLDFILESSLVFPVAEIRGYQEDGP